MTLTTFTSQYVQELQTGLTSLDGSSLLQAVTTLAAARREKRRVWLIGNGGSATLASHMATDLQLAGVAAQSLTDIAAVTTYANDSHFMDVFSLQLDVLARPLDVLIAISTSGDSRNVIYAVGGAFARGLHVIALTGRGGGFLGNVTMRGRGLSITCLAKHTGVIQDIQQTALHIIAYHLINNKEL